MDASSSFLIVALTLHSVVNGCWSLNPQLNHRRLLQLENINLPALSTDVPVTDIVHVPSTRSGSFPASGQRRHDPNTVAPPPAHALSKSPDDPAKAESRKVSVKWLYMVVIPVVIGVLLTGVACVLLPCRKGAVATIGPWKTGLSGQLQKAFVTGVPKLQRSELERACEDFSNIVDSYPHYTVYKGTLSSGVEIAVVSTMITSRKDWSDKSEACFRKKIDTLSRINQKNFVNLIGFCEEEEPFTRMMVLEYAPNGTIYENLHVEGFDHIDWRGRMRIIMGISYCIQHMHELNPPVVHPDLHSSAILLSEDGAAKVADMSVWQEVISEGEIQKNSEAVDHHGPVSAAIAGNVYSFGVLLLEIISGKLPYSEEEGSLVNLALECMSNDQSMACLLDPTLVAHKENEVETICQVIQDCIQSDTSRRPSMREITARLRDAVAISPVAATPRLSPLWWAELEILSSAEASSLASSNPCSRF